MADSPTPDPAGIPALIDAFKHLHGCDHAVFLSLRGRGAAFESFMRAWRGAVTPEWVSVTRRIIPDGWWTDPVHADEFFDFLLGRHRALSEIGAMLRRVTR